MIEEPQKVEETQGHDIAGGSVIEAGICEEQQSSLATNHNESLTDNLMEKICEESNLQIACKRVKANRGAPGIDGITTKQLDKWLRTNKSLLIESLIKGDYHPQPIVGVQIPKPGGGVRQLGIPIVIDRFVQQAILQVLNPIFDPTFSNSSFGFRPNRSDHQALTQASKYVEEGRIFVVDIDLEKFFDRVNHDILMGRLAKRIKDKRLLKIIRKYLQAGMMVEGVCIIREEGTPQGGPLSPFLSNFLLDELDKELEKRGHKFCRYADDCNIYLKTEIAGQRVMQSMTKFLENKLKLKVNQEKSAVAIVKERKVLGYRILEDGQLIIAPKSLEKAREKIRMLTRRWTPGRLEDIIAKLNTFLVGWFQYFELCEFRRDFKALDGWIRRRLRAAKLYQLKRPKAVRKFLDKANISEGSRNAIAYSGKGIWRLSKSNPIHKAMSNKWFQELGLTSLEKKWEELVII